MQTKPTLRSGITWSMLCCVLVMLLAGCGASSSTNKTKAADAQQKLRYADVSSDIATFDPAQATDAPSIQAIQMVFTGLLSLDDSLKVQPQLAKSYSVSSDGLTYTFHLRTGMKFSDGTTLNANDVAYSIDRALSPAIANLNGVTLTYLGLIKDANKRVYGSVSTLIGDSLKVVDDNTLEILVSEKTGYFLQTLTYPTSYVVEKSVVEKYTSSTWTDHLADNGGQGGDGPFKVKSYSHSTGIVFEPNSNYTGKQPQLKEVDFNFYKTAQTAYAAYQTGQVDFVDALPAAQLNSIKQLPNNQYSQNSELAIDYIAMNYLYKPFDNIKIREAFALAVNRNVLMSSVFQNGRLPSCHIVPEGMPGYNSSLTCPGGSTTRGDLVKAKTLFEEGLKEEGLTDATFPKVTITYSADSTALANEVTTLESEWNSALGVNVSSSVVEFNTLLSEEAKTACATPTNLSTCKDTGLQMWTAAWGADYPDPQDWITLQFGRGQANNMWNYGQNDSSAASTQQAEQTKMTAADAELDSTTRMASYNAIEQSVVNDVGWLSLDQRLAHRVVKPYVIGMTFNALSLTPPDNWNNVYIAQH